MYMYTTAENRTGETTHLARPGHDTEFQHCLKATLKVESYSETNRHTSKFSWVFSIPHVSMYNMYCSYKLFLFVWLPHAHCKAITSTNTATLAAEA